MQPCRNVPPAWTETSYSYSICRDVNTHTGIECCVMYCSSFCTFSSFLSPRAHSTHNTWTTIWSFRSFSSKNAVLFQLVNNNWTMEVFIPNFYIYPKTKYHFWMYPYKLWFHCPLTIQKSVSQKSQNRLFFIKKIYHKTIDIGVAAFLQGET